MGECGCGRARVCVCKCASVCVNVLLRGHLTAGRNSQFHSLSFSDASEDFKRFLAAFDHPSHTDNSSTGVCQLQIITDSEYTSPL